VIRRIVEGELMFGLFKKKKQQPEPPQGGGGSALGRLCKLHEELSNDVTELYSKFESYNPAELRFFSMSAVSVFVQAFGNLPESEMRSLIEKFTEQCVAMMLFYMPKAEYSQVHNAFISRFPAYPDLIVSVFNAQTTEATQESTFALVSAMDHYVRVERGAFDVSIAALKMSAILTDLAINVRNAVRAE
jgi:hypothetical protein